MIRCYDINNTGLTECQAVCISKNGYSLSSKLSKRLSKITMMHRNHPAIHTSIFNILNFGSLDTNRAISQYKVTLWRTYKTVRTPYLLILVNIIMLLISSVESRSLSYAAATSRNCFLTLGIGTTMEQSRVSVGDYHYRLDKFLSFA